MQRWITFFALFFMTLGQMAIDVYLPSMPSMVHALHTYEAAVQLTMTTFLLGYATSQLAYGALADCYGRRPVILFGLLLYTLAGVATLWVMSIQQLILCRFIQGVGIGAASVIGRVVMRDVFSGKQLAIVSAYMGITWSLVPLIAPVVGGYVEHYLSWRYNFGLMMVVGVLALMITWLKLPETLPQQQRHALKIKALYHDYRHILSEPRFVFHILILIMLYSMMVVFNLAAPFLLQVQLGITPAAYGWIILSIVVGYIMGSFLSAILVKRMSVTRAMILGLSIGLVSASVLFIAALAQLLTVWVIAVPCFIMFVASGILYPTATAESMQPFTKQVGSASALYGFIVIVGGSLFSMVMAYLPEHTLMPLAVSMLALVCFAVLFFGCYHLKMKKCVRS